MRGNEISKITVKSDVFNYQLGVPIRAMSNSSAHTALALNCSNLTYLVPMNKIFPKEEETWMSPPPIFDLSHQNTTYEDSHVFLKDIHTNLDAAANMDFQTLADDASWLWCRSLRAAAAQKWYIRCHVTWDGHIWQWQRLNDALCSWALQKDFALQRSPHWLVKTHLDTL